MSANDDITSSMALRRGDGVSPDSLGVGGHGEVARGV